MKLLWLDINSSYSHSSVALPAIHAQVKEQKEWEWCVVRGTINDDPGTLAAAVAEHNPDVIACTFWLFTHQMQLEILSRAVQLIDSPVIVCGGPEFLGNNESFLRKNEFITAIIRGEGEDALPSFMETLIHGNDIIEEKWCNVDGLCWISPDDGEYHDNGTARVLDFTSLRYPEESPFFKWDKPFVQLETTRGCFNTCKFCVSGGEKPVRQQSLEQVAERLENIYNHGIKDVRVLDRTFNHDTDRACRMLDLFCKYSGKIRFHLEIHPALLSERLKNRLRELPAGLLHLEAGIQSLDNDVLESCGRKGSLRSSLEGLEYLCALENVETHADLIAGLPYYTLEMLCNDIRIMAGLGVDELQIESLKVLPGTQMRREAGDNDLKYSPLPPYEVLQTPHMSPAQLKTAMQVSRMIDFYYNCKAWQDVVRRIILSDPDFIINFTLYLRDKMVLDSPLSLERRGELLYLYCQENHLDMTVSVSAAWILAGCSLKKTPAKDVIRVKNLQEYIGENKCRIEIQYGIQDILHRYFLLPDGERSVLFGFDSQNHHQTPSFMGYVYRLNG